MTDVNYILDPYGTNEDNHILNEVQTLSPTQDHPYQILIPLKAPFYTKDFKVEVLINNVFVPLTQEDYYFILPFISATISTGQPVFGGILITNSLITGPTRISYRTVGGLFVKNHAFVLGQLASTLYNPRTCYWAQLVNEPQVFPPTEHSILTSDLKGTEDVVSSIEKIVSLLSDPARWINQSHTANINNPHHVTADQIGLGGVLTRLNNIEQRLTKLEL